MAIVRDAFVPSSTFLRDRRQRGSSIATPMTTATMYIIIRYSRMIEDARGTGHQRNQQIPGTRRAYLGNGFADYQPSGYPSVVLEIFIPGMTSRNHLESSRSYMGCKTPIKIMITSIT